MRSRCGPRGCSCGQSAASRPRPAGPWRPGPRRRDEQSDARAGGHRQRLGADGERRDHAGRDQDPLLADPVDEPAGEHRGHADRQRLGRPRRPRSARSGSPPRASESTIDSGTIAERKPPDQGERHDARHAGRAQHFEVAAELHRRIDCRAVPVKTRGDREDLPAVRVRGGQGEDPRVRARGGGGRSPSHFDRAAAAGRRLPRRGRRRRCSRSSTRRARSVPAIFDPEVGHRLRDDGPRRPGVRVGRAGRARAT